jgi:hypothetical protein
MTETNDGFVLAAHSRAPDKFLQLRYIFSDARDLGARLGAEPASKARDIHVRNAIIIEVKTASYTWGAEWLAISGDRNAYAGLHRFIRPFGSYRTVTRAVRSLVETELIEKCQTRPSPNARYRSTIRAGRKLRRTGPLWHTSELTRHIHEPVRLKDKKKQLQPYRDTAFTRATRRDLLELNEFLISFEVTLESPRWYHNDHGLLCCQGRVLNPASNQLYRVYNGTWKFGGRFYGGWWQQLPAIDRQLLQINGHEVCELDYSHIHPTLISAIAGIGLGNQDPYEIEGFSRKHIKLSFNILINARTESSAVAAICQKLVELKCQDPAYSARQLVQVIKSRHPKFAFAWGTGFGLRLQNIDADICAEVQRQMRGRGHPVLSVHDSFIVVVSAVPHLEEVMEDVLARAKNRLAKQPNKYTHNLLL